MEWLNYHHLYYFWAAVREGSMTRAASELLVTPATLSIQIRELEKSAGCRLIKKSGRGFALTETGELVYQYATDIFALGEELKGAVRGRLPGAHQILRVGVKDVLPKLLAFKFLQTGMDPEKDVRLICREGELEQLVNELITHRLDVVLSDTPLDPSLKARVYSHLICESNVVLLGVEALASQFAPSFPEGLDRAPWILPTADTVLRRNMDQWFFDQGIVPRILGEFEDAAMLKIAGKAGLGLFAVPAIIADEVRQMYDVRPVAELPISERYYALSVERKTKHPSVLAITHPPKVLS